MKKIKITIDDNGNKREENEYNFTTIRKEDDFMIIVAYKTGHHKKVYTEEDIKTKLNFSGS